MDIESGHRYSQSSALNIPHHYYVSERNAPLTISNRTRHDPRGYPMGGPVGGPRMRGSINRSDDNEEDGPARRRIAVAVSSNSHSHSTLTRKPPTRAFFFRSKGFKLI